MNSLVKKKMAYIGRKIKKSPGTEIFHVRSEPGDFTRYDYWLDRVGQKKFVVSRKKNSFDYPQKEIDLIEIGTMSEKIFISWAKEEVCSPHTLAEVIAAATQIADGKF